MVHTVRSLVVEDWEVDIEMFQSFFLLFLGGNLQDGLFFLEHIGKAPSKIVLPVP